MSSPAQLVQLHNTLAQTCKNLVKNAENNNEVTLLYQTDFSAGTYIIDSPGVYRLAEDISFNPNSLAKTQITNPSATSWESGDPLPSQFTTAGGKYDPKAYGIGFFAAVAITCNDVVLDLNGFILAQSKEHALQQRFYANIELADQPFVSGQGPHDFGPKIDKASNCFIVNGTIGLSSHHGIHGNGNSKILLSNLTFVDYEVAAVALNGVKDLVVVDCTVNRIRLDLPVLGTFSGGRFLRPYLNKLESAGYTGTMDINGSPKTITDIKTALKTSLNNVYADLITNNKTKIDKTTHLAEWQLYHNDAGLIDGNCYGFLTNSLGVAVLGFPNQYILHKSQNVYMNNVVVNNHKGNIHEVLALPGNPDPNNKMYGSGAIQNDSVGSVFQTQNRDADGNLVTIDNSNNYVGNAVANAQAFVAKAILNEFNFAPLSTTRNSINYLTLDWIAGTKTLNDVAPGLKFLCNGDSMFHVNKGVLGFKIDATDYVYMRDCRVFKVENLGQMGSNKGSEEYINGVGKSHPDATYPGYGGANTRGFGFASSCHVTLEDCLVSDLKSYYGNAYGFDIHLYGNSYNVKNCEVMNVSAGCDQNLNLTEYRDNPTEKPVAYGFHVQEDVEDVTYSNLKVTGSITSPYRAIPCSFNMKHPY